MKQAVQQLEAVRRRARRLLLLQRVLEWLVALIGAAMVMGLVDFALRLPTVVRMTLVGLVGIVALIWFISRWSHASRFAPTLADLALRAEQVYPRLEGLFASAIEFTQMGYPQRGPEHATPRTHDFAAATIKAAELRMDAVHLNRLVDASGAARRVCLVFAVVVVMATGAIVAPTAAGTAAQRWLTPWTDAQWPKRTEVETLAVPAVSPVDLPITLQAQVGRGYRANMRVTAYHRVVIDGQPQGGFEALLMNDQSSATDMQAGTFERVLPALQHLQRRLVGEKPADIQLEVFFRAGDDDSEVQTIQLAARPEVDVLFAEITPPAYARGLVEVGVHEMNEQTGTVATAAGLVGSTVEMRLRTNRPFFPRGDEAREAYEAKIRAALPGLAALPGFEIVPEPKDASTIGSVPVVRVRFPLTERVETVIPLDEGNGLASLSNKRYRIEAIEDNPPSISLVEPSSDESVLATAVLPVQAMAQDDVGVEEVLLEADVPERAGSLSEDAAVVRRVLARQSGRRESINATHRLDLAAYADLRAGDVIELAAVAQDVFALDGSVHEPVRSPVRRLRIIDEADLVAQLRADLAGVRQQAVRMEQMQRALTDFAPEAVEQVRAKQAEISRRINSQQRLMQRLQERAERNRLDEPAMTELMDDAAELLEGARKASDQSARELQKAEQAADANEAPDEAALEPAREGQDQVREKLDDLMTLLDQGRDVLTLQLALRGLKTQQENLATEARRLMPQTVGRELDDLPEETREAVEDLAERQAELGEQARDLTRQMRAAAEVLERQSETDRDRAAAEALSEAADIAQRQGLRQQMKRSSESMEQNQLSQAGQQQMDALETLEQMLNKVGSQQEKMRELLKRRLAQLAQLLQQLIERQQGQLAQLEKAEDAQLPKLDPPQAALRRSTMAAQVAAEGAEPTQPAAKLIEQAVAAQAQAVLSLREAKRAPAHVSETGAIEKLTEALKLVQEARTQEQQNDAADQRAELQKAYEVLARRQDELTTKTREAAGDGPLDAQARRAVRKLAGEQSEIQSEANELREKIDQTIIFTRAHRRIDEGAARSTNALRRGRVNDETYRDQSQVALLLRVMAEALENAQDDEPFDEDSGGGGGGGGGAPPEVVPPIAELKLLRAMQVDVNDQTRDLAQQHGRDPQALPEGPRRRLIELSTQQRELADLTKRLLEKVNQQQQQAAPPAPKEGGEG